MSPNEEWRGVPGFEAAYEVSTSGRVRSLDRTAETKRGPVRLRGKLLKPGLTSAGYPSVCLGRSNTRLVHDLVALAFIGPRPADMEILHRDGSRENPTLGNLRYGTRLENIKDAQFHGTWWTPERYGPQRPRDDHGRFV